MEPTQPSVVSRLLRATALAEDALLVLILTAMVVLATTQIILRNFFDGAILWAGPMLRVGVLWVGMIGAMWNARVRVVTDLFTAIVAAVVAWSAFRLMLDDRAAGEMAVGFAPLWVCEAILPVAFGVIALRYVLFAIKHLKMGVAGEDEP